MVGVFKYLWVWFLQRLNVISSILIKYQPSTCLLYFRILWKCVFSNIQSPEAYLEPCKISMMELLTVYSFRHRSFATGSWIRLWHLAMSTSTLFMHYKLDYIIYFCRLKVSFWNVQRLPFRIFLKALTEAFSEPYQTTKIELFAKTFNGWKWTFIFHKTFILTKIWMPLIN